jgi:hypothetical protein
VVRMRCEGRERKHALAPATQVAYGASRTLKVASICTFCLGPIAPAQNLLRPNLGCLASPIANVEPQFFNISTLEKRAAASGVRDGRPTI